MGVGCSQAENLTRDRGPGLYLDGGTANNFFLFLFPQFSKSQHVFSLSLEIIILNTFISPKRIWT